MELRMYFDILVRRWRIALIVTVAIFCMAALGNQFISRTYQAETALRIVTPMGGALGETEYQTTFATRLMNTYVQIATSDKLNSELKKRLNLTTLPDIAVEIVPDSEIIKIIVESKDPALAANTANGLAELLYSYQDQAVKNIRSNELSVLADRVDELKTELTQYESEHDQLASVYAETMAEITVLDRAIRIKETSYENLRAQYEEVAISEAVAANSSTNATIAALTQAMNNVQKEIDALNIQYKELLTDSNKYSQQISLIRESIRNAQNAYTDLLYRYDSVLAATYRQENAQNIIVISPAFEPSDPVGPSRWLVLGLELILGIMIGVAAAFVLENLSDRNAAERLLKPV